MVSSKAERFQLRRGVAMARWKFRGVVVVCGMALLLQGMMARAATAHDEAPVAAPVAEIFAPGVISGPANDGLPTFSPDGNTLFFTRSTANWGMILESHRVKGQWSEPERAPFSGEWPDSSPSMSPDGKFLVFQSTRPAEPLRPDQMPKEGQPMPGVVSNLWRVDRVGDGWGKESWGKPVRLADAVNIGKSIWKPSVAADGTIYLTVIDEKGGKRLYSARWKDGVYERAQPLSFSDGSTGDVDPEIAPDQSFLVFVSSGRLKGDAKDHLFITLREGEGWGPVTAIRYAGDDKYGFSTDDEPHLGPSPGPDRRTVYFSSDRAVPVHFPRTMEQAERDLKRLESWDNSNSNVWSLPLGSWLKDGARM